MQPVGKTYVWIVHVPSPFQHAEFLTQATSPEPFEFHRSHAMNFVDIICME